MYDPGDKDIVAAVETGGCVVDNHLFNGGVYVATVRTEAGQSNLTPEGQALRKKFSSDDEFLSYISSVLNSPQIQEWGRRNPLERVRIPTHIEEKLARRMAGIEKSKSPPWSRTVEPETKRRKHLAKIADLFEDIIDSLEKAA